MLDKYPCAVYAAAHGRALHLLELFAGPQIEPTLSSPVKKRVSRLSKVVHPTHQRLANVTWCHPGRRACWRKRVRTTTRNVHSARYIRTSGPEEGDNKAVAPRRVVTHDDDDGGTPPALHTTLPSARRMLL